MSSLKPETTVRTAFIGVTESVTAVPIVSNESL